MSDLIDRAAAEEAVFLAEALAQHRLPENRRSYSHCQDCGEAIPAARQAAYPGCTCCIHCQQDHEQRHR